MYDIIFYVKISKVQEPEEGFNELKLTCGPSFNLNN